LKKYIRGISDKFIEDFREGKLSRLFFVINADSDLRIELRNNYVNVYYKGGRLLMIEPALDRYKFTFDIKYCDHGKETHKDLLSKIGKYDVDAWTDVIPILKTEMDYYFLGHPKLERRVQQEFCVANSRSDASYLVVDIEYQTGNESRVDMLALTKKDNAVKIVLVELKQGLGAITGSAGLTKHYNDFTRLITNNADSLKETVVNIYQNKVALGLLPNTFEVEKIDGFEILFVLYDYNERSILLDNALKEVEDVRIQEIPFGYVKKSKGSFKL